MKKERIVVLCICAVFLGSLYSQWIAWVYHLAMPSITQPVRPMPFRPPFRAERQGYSVVEFLSAGWPPVGVLYGEARMIRQRMQGMQTPPEGNRDTTLQTAKGGRWGEMRDNRGKSR